MRKHMTSEFYAAIQMNSMEYDLALSTQIHASVACLNGTKEEPQTVEINIKSRSKTGLYYAIIRFQDESSPIHDSEQYCPGTTFHLIGDKRIIATGIII